jgi:hypothetical protein
MDRPPPDPAKLLGAWMEWERGENPPGRVMATLKTGGLRDLLERLVAEAQPVDELSPAEESAPSTEAWKPLV